MGSPRIIDTIDFGEREGGIGNRKCRTVWSASQRVSLNRSARAGRAHVDVISEFQNVGTAGAGITSRHNDAPWQLLLHVEIELLNSTLLEIRILRQNGAFKIGG